MQTFYYRHSKANRKIPTIPETTINYNELTFVIKGEFEYVLNGITHTVSAGDCVIVKSGENRMRKPTKNCDYVSFNFYTALPENFPTTIKESLSGEITMLITLCDEMYSKYYDWKNKIDSALDLIIKLLKEKLLRSGENPTAIKIKRYLKAQIGAKLSLSAVAKSVGYSPNYCDTLFKKETGTSIFEYLTELRISEAKLLLTEGILKLTEIAEAVGFEDYNYFARTFKKNCGYTPSEYKRIANVKRI